MAAEGKVGLRASSGNKTLAFGLVRVQVGMSPLSEESSRIKGRFIDPDSREPVKRVWMVGEEIVDDPVTAYDYQGTMVELDNGDVGREVNTDVINLEANVVSSAVPAEWVEKSYLIWPKDAASAEAYALLLAYCRDTGRALVGTTVDKGTDKAFVIRYSDTSETLVAQLLAYEANVRWNHVEQITAYMAEVGEPDAAASNMAATLFDSLPDTFDWSSVTDTYGEALLAAVAAKANGQTPEAPEASKVTAPKGDALMDMLKASVAAASSDKTKEGVPA